MPLGHLIALIINAHPLGSGSGRAFDERFDRPALNRKTSLLRIVPTACGQAADIALATRSHARRFSSPCDATTFNARRLRIDRDLRRGRLSERSYLFTMSDITHPHEALAAENGCKTIFSANEPRPQLVEPDGIEPTTSCLQSRRSPN